MLVSMVEVDQERTRMRMELLVDFRGPDTRQENSRTGFVRRTKRLVKTQGITGVAKP